MRYRRIGRRLQVEADLFFSVFYSARSFLMVFLTLCLLFIGLNVEAESDTNKNCEINAAPENALSLKQANGAFSTVHYPDPKLVSDDYSGCLNIWFEGNGKVALMSRAVFKNGQLQELQMPELNVVCYYNNGKLAQDKSSPQCPPSKGGAISAWR